MALSPRRGRWQGRGAIGRGGGGGLTGTPEQRVARVDPVQATTTVSLDTTNAPPAVSSPKENVTRRYLRMGSSRCHSSIEHQRALAALDMHFHACRP